jgi:hypothetical protein
MNYDRDGARLLAALDRVWAEALCTANECHAIVRAVERDWIAISTASRWAEMKGLVRAEPAWVALWRGAARRARIEKYGPGGILERESAR